MSLPLLKPLLGVIGLLAAGVAWSAVRQSAGGGGFVGPLLPDGDSVDQVAANRHAFLEAIRWAEGTSGPDGFRALFGHRADKPSLFASFAQHPTAGGWKGVPLSDKHCAAAGFGAGCVTTAAGGWQMIYPTWRRVQEVLGLPDFTPESQRRAALYLVQEAGALDDVDAGRFDLAVAKVRRIWASMPGAGYEQGERSLAALRQAYFAAGGTTA